MEFHRSSSDPRLVGHDETFNYHNKFMTLGNYKRPKFEGISAQKGSFHSKESQNGYIRFYRPSGQQSVSVFLSTKTTVEELCKTLNLDIIFLRIGNQQIRQLSPESRPLQMQNEILQTLGYSTIKECLGIGGSDHLSHIFCFFSGRPLPSIQDGISSVLLVANCLVGRGKLYQRWSKKRCILYNDTIRIENDSSSSSTEGDEDNILLLNKFKVTLADSNHGRCLKLTSNTQKICFVFEDPADLQQWSAHATQCTIVPNCDLSNAQLLFLPDKLFYVGSQKLIKSLNLRRNSLLMKPVNTMGCPLIGWLDDVSRFPSLRSLNVADNCLYKFPIAVLKLFALTELILSGNRIPMIPNNIRLLNNLNILNLSNNWLTSLPKHLSECQNLHTLDLSFNRFRQIPPVLLQLPNLTAWELAGNYIHLIDIPLNSVVKIQKLDSRLNTFERPLRLTSFVFESLTILDLRQSGQMNELDLSNLSSLQVLHCAYLKLKTIRVNGTCLREFYAENNQLNLMVVMPIPSNLTILSVAHNQLETLPEWITDIHNIVTINAHHNQIKKLPYRTMMNISSLRHLLMGNNKLTKLPDIVENCSIEIMNLENNFIEKLPAELFCSAHQLRHLNLTNNCLKELPPTNTFVELNRLQFLRLSGNILSESCMSTIVSCRKLRLLDVSYNNFRFFNDSALSNLLLLEELNISGNKLTSLSTELAQLPNLQIIRAHSNRISAIPDLSFSKSLKIIDLSNNRLTKLNVEYCVAENLKFLDLTCNPFSDHTRQLDIKSERRAVSIVDISRKSILSNIQFGFSESSGQKAKLSARQIRPKDSNNLVFAIIDGGSNPEIAQIVKTKLEHSLAVLNREDPETLRRAILRTHEDIGENGIQLGASTFILRILNNKIWCASSGHISALLSKKDGEIVYFLKEIKISAPEEYSKIRSSNAIITSNDLINGVAPSTTSIGYSHLFPTVVPNPRFHQHELEDEDEFIVIANRILWQTLTEREIIEAVRQCNNSLQAAKKLQDMCQALEQVGNISIIVIVFALRENQTKKVFNTDSRFTTLRSKVFTQNEKWSPISVQTSSPRKSIKKRSLSEQRINGINPRSIENRLEEINAAINQLGSDSSNGMYHVNPPSYDEFTMKRKNQPLKKSPASVESRLSVSVTESRSSTPLFHRDLTAEQSYLSPNHDVEFFHRFSPQTSDAGISEDSSVFSQEKFKEARNRIAKGLRLEQPKMFAKQHLYIRRHF